MRAKLIRRIEALEVDALEQAVDTTLQKITDEELDDLQRLLESDDPTAADYWARLVAKYT